MPDHGAVVVELIDVSERVFDALCGPEVQSVKPLWENSTFRQVAPGLWQLLHTPG